MATDESKEIAAGVEGIGLKEEPETNVDSSELDQKSFFRAVQEGHEKVIEAFLKNKQTIDVNAYNPEGATALLLAVYKYEVGRNVEVTKTLLKYGADITVKAAPPPSAHKISIVRHDAKHQGPGPHENSTKKISFDHKTALLVALELKSSLYLKGWEYRHWDALIQILANATVEHYVAKDLKLPSVHHHSVSEIVQRNWEAVYKSGKHELVELVAEGKDIVALKLLVTGSSKILKLNLVETNRVEIRDASYNLLKALVHFLYVGKVDAHFLEHRGIDLYRTAHKYGVSALKYLLESSIVPTQETWIKLLQAAVDSDSDVLSFKTAQSIKEEMQGRETAHLTPMKSMSALSPDPRTTNLSEGQS